MVANNPTKHALVEAMHLFPNSDVDLIVSLGTGISRQEEKEYQKPPQGWASMVSTFIRSTTNSEKTHEEIKRDLPLNDRTEKALYVRIQPKGFATHIEMDEHKEKTLSEAMSEIRQYMHKEHAQTFRQLFDYYSKTKEDKPPVFHLNVAKDAQLEKEENQRFEERLRTSTSGNSPRLSLSQSLNQSLSLSTNSQEDGAVATSLPLTKEKAVEQMEKDKQCAYMGAISRRQAEDFLRSQSNKTYLTRYVFFFLFDLFN